MKRTLFISALGFTMMLPAAFGTPITPGMSGPPDNFATPPYSGAALASTGSQTVSTSLNGSTLSITYMEQVYKDTSTSYLDYVLSVTNNGPDVLERATAGDFSGFTTDLGYVGSSAGSIPNSVDRSGSGVVAGFNLTGASDVPGGSSTKTLVIETNAPTYTLGTVSFQDGVTVNGTGFAPSSGTPEPATMFLLGSALLGLGFIRKRVAK